MDRMTFESFQNYAISGARSQSQKMNLLTKAENDLSQYLKMTGTIQKGKLIGKFYKLFWYRKR
ncbi:hypothetical protein [Pedobacter sp. KACC 23697]|uniref:hypothetical protein n=1 Tax=Pedobacter sp. KACC 23697 TaxID=3149230 RepID=UPI00387810A4